MDLNDFIFRDDTAEPLGAGTPESDDLDASEDSLAFVTPAKLGVAAVGSAVLGMSHFLSHTTKHL